MRPSSVARLLVLGALAWPMSARSQGNGFDFSALDLPPGFLELSDLTIAGPRPGVTIGMANTVLMGNSTAALVSTFPSGKTRGMMLALKPTDWSLTRTFPSLANPILDELTFKYVGLVVSNQALVLPAYSLSREERQFFREIYQKDDFVLDVRPGVNLIAAIPAGDLPADHPLNAVMDALGIEKGTILIQGTLGKSLSLLTNPAAGGAAIVRDLSLRAELPAMRPPGSPAWFNSGQLALEITGLPSLRLVGEMSVNVQEDQLTFFVAAALARTGMTLAGGLQADSTGWEQPFGIEWLTLNKVVLMLGITPTGSVQLGFAGDAVFGEKDLAVAVAIAVSPAGVPTNFMVEGESEAGVALSDLALVQQRMAAAAGQDKPSVPIDALPNIAITKMGLRFAPKPAPELGIEQGMAIKGRLMLELTRGGELTDFAGVDVNVSKDGLWIRGDIGKLELGPLTIEDSKLDLTRTPEVQHFILKGATELLGARREIDVEFSRSGLSFRSETRLWELFSSRIEANAAFDLKNPAFKIHAEMQNDFADALAPYVGEGLRVFAQGGEAIINDAREIMGELDRVLADREADVERIVATFVAVRAQADAAAAEARDAARAAQSSAAGVKRQVDAAYGLFQSTPYSQPVVRAQRHAAYAALFARWRAQVAVANGLLAALNARERILAALPPIEQRAAVVGARAALQVARDRTQAARQNLDVMSQRFAAVVAAVEKGGLPFTIREASFDADLAALVAGQAVQWRIAGSFLDAPFTIQRSLDFSNVAAATAQLVQELIG